MPRFARFHLARLLTRRQEGPFLFALVFLFFMSGGFLVVQVWGNPDSQGAAAGLLTPTALPTLTASAVPLDRAGESVVASEAATPAPTLDSAPTPVEPPKKEPQPAIVEPPQTQVLPAALPVVSKEKKEPKHATPEPKKAMKPVAPAAKDPVAEKKAPVGKPIKTVVAAKEMPSMIVAPPLDRDEKPAPVAKKKSRKSSRKPEPEPSFEPPKGWVWFSAPLEWKLIDGKWKIEVGSSSSALSVPSSEEVVAESPEDDAWANAVAIEDEPECDLPVVPAEKRASEPAVPAPQVRKDIPEEVPVGVVEPSVSAGESSGVESRGLFQKALEKIERTKERRAVEAVRYRVDLPSRGGSTRAVPASLVRLMDAVDQLSGKAQASPLSQNPSSESVQTDGLNTLSLGSAAGSAEGNPDQK